jgi:flagellar biosynthesis/type III secretory pathway protein FliH
LEKLEETAGKAVSGMSRKERWACFFRYYRDRTKEGLIEELVKSEEGIAMAAEVIEGFSAEQVAYFHEVSKEKYQLDMQAHRDEAHELGYAEGLEEGSAAGLEEGQRRVFELLESGKTLEEAKHILGLG